MRGSYDFTPEMPLGLGYLASTLLQAGFKVSIIDCLGEALNKRTVENGLYTLGLTIPEVQDRIREEKPDLIGIACMFSSRFQIVKKIAEAAKTIDYTVQVVVGGIHPTIRPFEVLAESSVDFAVLGEGESTILNLAMGRSPEEMDGVAYKDSGEIHVNPKTRYIEDLDTIPFPARHLFNPEYFQESRRGLFRNTVYSRNTVITSRGCPNHCSFCGSHSQWGYKWRARSPENVVQELKQFKEAYGIRHVSFDDDNLTLNRKRMVDLCNLMIQEKLDLKWDTPNGVSIITLDRELLSLMKKAGCYSLTLAVESGDPYILKNVIKKPLTLKKAKTIAHDCKKVGIEPHGFFVIGMVGDCSVTLRNSLDFLRTLPLNDVGVFIAKPYPDTELYNECVRKGYIQAQNFSELITVDVKKDLPCIATPWLSTDEVLAWRKRFYKEFQKASLRHLALYAFRKVRQMVLPYANDEKGFSGRLG